MDRDDFCGNIRICERAMYSLALSVLRNEEDASDAISESVYRAYKNIDTLKNDSSFKPWILRIVHNTAVEMIRKNENITPVDELPEKASWKEEEDTVSRLTLREAVESLKSPYDTVVILFYYENLSVSKIAQITGTNIAAVKQQLSRARKMLREILKEDFS